jgi:hypothetical protein
MNDKVVINMIKDYNQCELFEEDVVKYLRTIFETRNILRNSKKIELNLTGCGLSYPKTPQFIDYFLEHLSKLIIKMSAVANCE